MKSRWRFLGVLGCLGLAFAGCTLDDIRVAGADCKGLSKIKVESGSILS